MREPTKVLGWLLKECRVPADQSRTLVASSWLRIQYISPLHQDRLIGVVATALHLTISKYGWQRINFQSLARGWQHDDPYRGVMWNGTCAPSVPLCFGPLSGRLVASEILGYFVLCLLRCAGLNSLSGQGADAGTAAFDPIDYSPTWILKREERNWLLRFRERVASDLVVRLIKRYRDKPLQRLVSCSWQASHATLEIERISATEMPQELVQFPRVVEGRDPDEA